MVIKKNKNEKLNNKFENLDNLDEDKERNLQNYNNNKTNSWADKVKNHKNQNPPKNYNLSNQNNLFASKQKINTLENEQIEIIDDPNVDNGRNIMLPFNFILWSHDLYNKQWNLESYKQLCKISNVSDFWKLYNNFHKIGFKYMHFFLMKEGVEPIWEHEKNRNGGICSFKIELENSYDVWEDLSVLMVCNMLLKNSEDINGISMSPKNNSAIIKLWNSDNKNDLSVNLYPEILKKYEKLSIKYKSNSPEY